MSDDPSGTNATLIKTAIGLLLAVLGLTGGGAWRSNENGGKLEVLEERLAAFHRESQASTVDRYTGSMASRDFKEVWQLLQQHEKRIERLEAAR